jgi:site-specific DNA recombinase
MHNLILRAAGYRRVSMREQVDGFSLAAQETNIRQHVQAQGWELVELYTDAGISAKKDSQRPALVQLLRDAQAGKFEVVVVDKLDRFYRHLRGLLTALDQLNDANVSFVSVQERLDFTSVWGKLTLTVLGTLAEIYIQNLQQETRKGKLQRARDGLWNGNPPFGYCRGACSNCKEPMLANRI